MIKTLIKKLNNIVPVTEDRSVEKAIYLMNKNKIRSLKVETLYNEVRYLFKINIQNKKLRRSTILEIRRYLEKNIDLHYTKEFKNDAHAIYTYLKNKSIKAKHLKYIKELIVK